MTHGVLFQAFVYLMAAVIAVPLAKRFGLGSVLGYLLAGMLIGPHALDLVGHEGEVQHFAEFGVVMMLFLIGLELQPAVLWKLRVPILGLGGLQVAGTAAVAAPLAMLAGLSWKASLATGLIVAMSSTAIVLTSLKEKGWSRNAGGQSAFAVLLFQDIAVIPILAVMPLLADTGAAEAVQGAGGGHGASGVAALPPWAQALSVLAAVAVVVAGGRFLSRPVFRFIAGSRLREVFTAAALLLVVGIALLMQGVGMSPALGAFLAGVVLADNEYRHELEGDIEPFKGLLLGLFFITVGAGVDLPYIAGQPGRVAGLVLSLMALKAGFLFALAKAFRIGTRDAVLLALALCQVGEFAFVLLSLSQSLHVLSGETAKLLVAATALSMALTPPLFILLDRAILPRLTAAKPASSREQDRVEDGGAPVLIAGFGRMGNLIGRLLRANGIKTTVLELNPDVVDSVRKLGLEAYYGDASRLDLLHAAGAERARLLILALDNPEKTLEIVETAKKHFPHLHILARATGRMDAYALVNHGLPQVFRETFGTALDMGYHALRRLGMRGMQAHRAVRAFEGHNEKAFRELARLAGDDKAYVSALRAKIGEAEDLLKDDRLPGQHLDLAWDNAPLREAARAGILER